MGQVTRFKVYHIRGMAVINGDTDIIQLCDAYLALETENTALKAEPQEMQVGE